MFIQFLCATGSVKPKTDILGFYHYMGSLQEHKIDIIYSANLGGKKG